MSQRENALNDWLKQLPELGNFSLTSLAGDASFRRYFRLNAERHSYIVMDAPPGKESLISFIQVNQILRSQGVHAPEILAKNTAEGFLLLEDLGDTLLATNLNASNRDARYQACLDTLITIQKCPTKQPMLPRFDTAYMIQEMTLFKTWFLDKFLGVTISLSEEKKLKEIFIELSLHLNDQPQCFIHRDYHSRNILIVKEDKALLPEIAVIDFQDAMEGPFTYDLVSLLKDCYVNWKEESSTPWAHYFYKNLPNTHGWSFDEFKQGFDWCGLQRHLKVLGIFSRLFLRDNKPNYLNDLPLTLSYTKQCAVQYPAFHALYEIIEKKISPVFKERQPA